MKRIRLTDLEIETLLAAAGNVDPSMFDDGAATKKQADREKEAWESGMEKLRHMLARREDRKQKALLARGRA
ncbi:MAG: hypothetical protein QOI12_3667 [Alphaproteobacteria bacterium]|jgi:hypothetical protein|nr:hypothetical protein [Alphaproteobacteria bacterium]